MSVVWNDQTDWHPTFLESGLVALSNRTLKPVTRASRSTPVLYQVDDSHVLVVPLDLGFRINGRVLPTGMHVMKDRDLLEVQGGACCFYSTEKKQIVSLYQGDPCRCPRCKTEIKSAAEVVYCAGCSAVYHQSDVKPCWTYGPTCIHCSTIVDLGNNSFRWTPDEL